MATINFGIDLGTTNSLIAKAVNGTVEIFKNPSGMKETLPSVVAFRKERILIGDKAKEYVEKDPQNVFASFKRKMGTSESFFVPNTGSFKTPAELSTLVLQELKNFIYTGEVPASVVITIPASFDTIQSNATKQAGYEAGFKEVVLLQEPVAASLAFANKTTDDISGQWLVYDLGGGTFDVAIVKVEDEEMKVTDHEGDNFLGGLDFDNLLVTRIVVPWLEQKYGIDDLVLKMQSAKGIYNKLYYKLLYKAEEAKITLSSQEEADIEFEFTDADDEEHEVLLTVTRAQFESIIREKIEYSVNFIHTLLKRNGLTPADINEVVLVGGSTYIPLVRQLLKEKLQVKVNASINPATAVAIGAAYYAGGKTTQLRDEKPAADVIDKVADIDEMPLNAITVKTAYQKSSREREEYFTAVITNAPADCSYRITREDGGYDSGIKPAAARISEMLILLPDTLNIFRLKFYDARQNPLPANVPEIAIMQGKFSIYGQPLPNDICLEVDDLYNNITQLEVIFERNALLPLKKNITKTLSRTIAKGSQDEVLINILEGSRYASPQSNLPIGIISIKGTDIGADLIKGCDIELSFEISESRDITITAYISLLDKEYRQVFSPSVRTVHISRLEEEVDYLARVAERRLGEMIKNEQYEQGAVLQDAVNQLGQISRQLKKLKEDDVTDAKYQLDDQKRKLALVIDAAGKEQRVLKLKEEYYWFRENCKWLLSKISNPPLHKKFDDITAAENEWLANNGANYIKRKIDELRELSWQIRRKDVEYVTQLYLYYATKDDREYKDVKKAAMLKKRGDEALERKNADEITGIIYQLYDLLIDKGDEEPLEGTGLRG